MTEESFKPKIVAVNDDNDFEIQNVLADSPAMYSSVWLTLDMFSIYIRRTHEGMIAEVYGKGHEDGEPMSSLQAWEDDVPDNFTCADPA